MENKEILSRIYYIDVVFGVLSNSEGFDSENIESELIKIKKESEDLFINNIKKKILEVNQNNGFWYDRFEDKDYVKEKVNVANLIIEREHDNLDGIENSSGKKISDFLNENKNKQEVLRRLNFILKNFETINKFLPIIVKQNVSVFEVMSGNHRAMAYIKKGYETIEVFVVK